MKDVTFFPSEKTRAFVNYVLGQNHIIEMETPNGVLKFTEKDKEMRKVFLIKRINICACHYNCDMSEILYLRDDLTFSLSINRAKEFESYEAAIKCLTDNENRFAREARASDTLLQIELFYK